MKRRQVFVRAQDETGKFGNADIFDLDEESWRVFVADRLLAAGLIIGENEELVSGARITLRTKRGIHFDKGE